MTTPEGLRLAKSFMRISNVHVRRRIVDLIEQIRLRPSIEYGVRCQSPPYLRPHLQRSDERRLHDTRHNGIDPYPEWTNFRGEAAHHLDNAGFRCAINGQAGLERRRANR